MDESQAQQPNTQEVQEQVYVNASSYGGQAAVQPEFVNATQEQQLATNEQPPVNEELKALADKVGIPPEQLGKAPEQDKPDTPVNPDDWYAKQFGEPEAKQFADNFKKFVGIDIKDVYGLINNTAQVTQGLEGWRQEVYAKQQIESLRTEFGSDYDTVMPQVLQEFQRIREVNPQQAQALDNIDGARYLAAYVRQQGQASQQQPQAQTQIPSYDFPNVRHTNMGNKPPAPTIRMSDFITWSDEEVQSRMPELVAARKNGTFIHDI